MKAVSINKIASKCALRQSLSSTYKFHIGPLNLKEKNSLSIYLAHNLTEDEVAAVCAILWFGNSFAYHLSSSAKVANYMKEHKYEDLLRYAKTLPDYNSVPEPVRQQVKEVTEREIQITKEALRRFTTSKKYKILPNKKTKSWYDKVCKIKAMEDSENYDPPNRFIVVRDKESTSEFPTEYVISREDMIRSISKNKKIINPTTGVSFSNDVTNKLKKDYEQLLSYMSH